MQRASVASPRPHNQRKLEPELEFMCPNPFSDSAYVEPSTFIPKSSGLPGTFCHLFLSSQSAHCFLVNTCTERGSLTAWAGRAEVVVCSESYGTERDCAGNSKPSSFGQLSQRTNRLVLCIPGILAWVAG